MKSLRRTGVNLELRQRDGAPGHIVYRALTSYVFSGVVGLGVAALGAAALGVAEFGAIESKLPEFGFILVGVLDMLRNTLEIVVR